MARPLLDPIGAGDLPLWFVLRQRARSAPAYPRTPFWLAAWILSACVPDYRPPNFNEPHALVKVRLAYHAWPGSELEQLVSIDGNDVREIPPPEQHGVAVATRPVLVRPGSAVWTFRTTFFHNDVTSHAETYESKEDVPCDSTTCVQSTPHTRQVNRVERVDDATCAQSTKLLAVSGETYTLEYEYLANQQCTLHCHRQVHRPGGAAASTPCADTAAPSNRH